MAYFEQVNGVAADYLLGGGGVPVLTQNVKAAVGEYKRGQVLENNSGTFQKIASGKPAGIVVADTTTTTDHNVVTVYVSGRFNREVLVVDTAYKINEHEADFKDSHLFLTSIK